MFVFRHAAGAAMKDIGEILFTQAVESVLNFAFSECRNRIAIVLLIAGERQRIKRQRIVFGCRNLLFDERTKDTNFVWG